MRMIEFDDVTLHYAEAGAANGAPLVFANSLGTDFRIWDKVVARLPAGLRIIRYDKRGHGLSQCTRPPYSMDALVHDVERLLDALGVRGCTLVGLSIGGMIAQGLAAKRPDQVAAAVLSNTGAKIGTPELWRARIEGVAAGGIESLADAVMERWFSARFRRERAAELMGWRNMLTRTPGDGYAGCSAAISGVDMQEGTSGLRLPVLAIAGSEDGATPPDLVRETAALIPGARFELIRGSGHLPCIEDPDAYAALLGGFLREVGHV